MRWASVHIPHNAIHGEQNSAIRVGENPTAAVDVRALCAEPLPAERCRAVSEVARRALLPTIQPIIVELGYGELGRLERVLIECTCFCFCATLG